MSIVANSRNLLTQTVTVLNPLNGQLAKPVFVNLRPRVTAKSPDDQLFTVDSSRSWAALSAQTLGDARFWWSFADLSNVVDPFAELTTGRQVRGPSIHRLLFDILAPANTST